MHHWPMLIPQPGDLRRRLLAELESDQIGQFCRLPQRITEPVAFLQEGTVKLSGILGVWRRNRSELTRRNFSTLNSPRCGSPSSAYPHGQHSRFFAPIDRPP